MTFGNVLSISSNFKVLFSNFLESLAYGIASPLFSPPGIIIFHQVYFRFSFSFSEYASEDNRRNRNKRYLDTVGLLVGEIESSSLRIGNYTKLLIKRPGVILTQSVLASKTSIDQRDIP
jgi:hypothetical protein